MISIRISADLRLSTYCNDRCNNDQLFGESEEGMADREDAAGGKL